MNEPVATPDPADRFAVSRSMRFFGRLCHEFPRVWTGLAHLETAMLDERIESVRIDRPIYVTSLARSGTTVLLEMLASVPGMVTHRYKDFPPVLVPYLWNRFLERVPQAQAEAQERPHGDGILITPDSPEAMEEVVWMRFFPAAHDPAVSSILDRGTEAPEFAAFYRDHIRKLLLARGGSRYLAKGNYNISRLAYIHELFPDARIVVPVRHPVSHIASLMRQHERFTRGQQAHPAARAHLKRVGHFEFGLDRAPINMGDSAAIEAILRQWQGGDELGGWALYWSQLFGRLLDQLDADPELRKAALVIRYEDLCAEPESALANLYTHCSLEVDRQMAAIHVDRLRGHRAEADRFGESILGRIRQVAGRTMQRLGYSA